LHGSKDDGYFKEEQEIDIALMIVFFLLCAIVGYVLAHLL
jgi:hypothetical protein